MPRHALHAALVLALLVLPACGDLGGDRKGVQALPAERVEEDAVERYATGTPERTVLEWFRALQGGEARRAAGFYSAGLAVDEQQIARGRRTAARFFERFSMLGVLDVSRSADRATVFTEIAARWAAPNGRGQEVRRPQAFTLVREGDGWRLADDLFLDTARELAIRRPKQRPKR
jgi:ketosteroid isomerase-like protein